MGKLKEFFSSGRFWIFIFVGLVIFVVLGEERKNVLDLKKFGVWNFLAVSGCFFWGGIISFIFYLGFFKKEQKDQGLFVVLSILIVSFLLMLIFVK